MRDAPSARRAGPKARAASGAPLPNRPAGSHAFAIDAPSVPTRASSHAGIGARNRGGRLERVGRNGDRGPGTRSASAKKVTSFTPEPV